MTNKEDAETLLKTRYNSGLSEVERLGFEYVDSGSYREVFRKGDIVFKLQYQTDSLAYDVEYGNQQEYNNATRFKGMPGVPPVEFYTFDLGTVITMPYFSERLSKEHPSSWREAMQLARVAPFKDIKPANMRVDLKGSAWYVDLAAPVTEPGAHYVEWYWRD